MTERKKVFLLLLSFTLGFSVGLNFKVIYESNSFKPYGWDNPPDIINCYGDDFSKLQMARAISYWTIRGYSTGDYIHKPNPQLCNKKWFKGAILLKKSLNLPHSTLASTRRYSAFSSMQGAVIYYQPGSYNLDLLNEHELGHALGFTHLEIDNHIMHPRYDKMGRNFWIPAE